MRLDPMSVQVTMSRREAIEVLNALNKALPLRGIPSDNMEGAEKLRTLLTNNFECSKQDIHLIR